jgi:hypothetical protein
MNSFASSKRTNPVDLPAHLRDPLISYTAAAGAALSVAAQAAEAKVVYVPTSVDVTNGYGIDIGGTRVLTFRTVSFGNADGRVSRHRRRGHMSRRQTRQPRTTCFFRSPTIRRAISRLTARTPWSTTAKTAFTQARRRNPSPRPRFAPPSASPPRFTRP